MHINWSKIKSVSLSACLGPMQEMGMNFKHQGTVDCRQNIEMPSLSILVNPKLVWNSLNLACYNGAASTCPGKFFSHLGQFWVYASHKPELLTTSMMVSVGNVCPTFGDETISIASYCFQNFSRVNIEQHECFVIFCDFSGFIWTFLCINWVFNAFMCIIQISTTCRCSNAPKLVEKSYMCPWVQA